MQHVLHEVSSNDTPPPSANQDPKGTTISTPYWLKTLAPTTSGPTWMLNGNPIIPQSNVDVDVNLLQVNQLKKVPSLIDEVCPCIAQFKILTTTLQQYIHCIIFFPNISYRKPQEICELELPRNHQINGARGEREHQLNRSLASTRWPFLKQVVMKIKARNIDMALSNYHLGCNQWMSTLLITYFPDSY
ncbi:hypothetical protein ACOSQ3_007016 [Xanthoceras sorbifolium]